MKYLIKYAIWIVLGGFIIIALAVAFSSPHHVIFPTAHLIKRFWALFLGIFYPLLVSLMTITPLILIIVFLGVLVTIWGLWRLWRARRYPLLIPITALIGANILFFGTGQFLDIGRVVSPIVICQEYRLSPTVTFQIIRYPIEARLRDDAQTFILISRDENRTWRQILTAYTVNPQIGGCAHIQAEFNNDQTWAIILEERRENSLQNDRVRYTTTDGGETFSREVE
ncbi:MAG: hypothetical protein CUN52_00305 [Phototrophicales bacterium]|nr:MAG: hypothetical protein CUN52_00305 [Phototrophicales bacterium]